MTTVPKQVVFWLAASRMALNRFASPSHELVSDWRIEPVTTTGLSLRSVRSSQ
jgi:hypothetical protein